jgi:outer membrane protein OmpA-like peptidoglycan-associated protein
MKTGSTRDVARLSLLSVAGALVLAGCGTTNPPEELVQARETYARVSKGIAAQYKPDELHEAKEALDNAQQSFDKDGPSPETRDLSYAAGLKAQQAEAEAATIVAVAEKDANEKKAQAQTIDTLKHEVNVEKSKREQAEKKAEQAAQDLARIAAVKQESRGMVITLSGAVLFTSGQSALLPGAMAKLNEVGEALVKSSPESKIVVEGHTDSQGRASDNQELSLARAQSVRDYLVSRGIAADRISAQGLGSTRPVATNKTPEGRADNRRVEIVVQPSPGGS